MKKPTAFLLASAAVVSLAGGIPRVLADGPTPFPDQKDEAAWPGKGPIRVGAWMKDNREYFWTQRQNDQGAVVFVGDSSLEDTKRLRLSPI